MKKRVGQSLKRFQNWCCAVELCYKSHYESERCSYNNPAGAGTARVVCTTYRIKKETGAFFQTNTHYYLNECPPASFGVLAK